MSDPHQPKDVAAYNEDELEGLAWAIEASVGQFKLFLARCNYTRLRSRLVERLQELTGIEIRILELKTSEKTLYARIQAELDSEQPDALMVFGLESVGDLDELLSATNQVREEFRKNFHFPVVLWVSDEVLKKLLQLAPDFESWAITTDFRLTAHELVDFLKETAEQFFEGNLTLTLDACREIKLACQDLQTREQVLDLELEANIESLLGLTEYVDYVNRNLDNALEHYQKGLKLWQQRNNLERQGKLLRDIAFCYYLKALRHREIDHPYWQSTRHYIRQCLEVLEQAQRPDLVANSILSLGRVLRRLQDWEQLRQSEPRNLRTVLIFDQFEEFFFAYSLPAERRRFFEFLGKCLNILPVKVILSLREDYIHYLLECNRLPSMAIIGNDILTKHVLYQLRNFSPTDARSIIQKLTESSINRLEPALIDKLVQDLTNESGEVRPIELQVLGAQLYEEGITTLKQYGQLAQPKLRRGKLSVLSCKEILLERWLERVIEDCGSLNKSFAWEILYSLTNETGTRPLKTKNELARVLNANFPSSGRKIHQVPDTFIPYGYNPEGGFSGQFRPAPTLTRTEFLMGERKRGIISSSLEFSQKEQSPSSAKARPKDTQLDLILEILVGSGLVLQLREEPEDRYQLVHDYLSTFIRQSQNFDMEERLVRTQEAKALREEQLNLEVRKLRTVISSLTTLCLVAFAIVVLSFLSTSSQLPSGKGLAYGALLWMGISASVLFYSYWQMGKQAE